MSVKAGQAHHGPVYHQVSFITDCQESFVRSAAEDNGTRAIPAVTTFRFVPAASAIPPVTAGDSTTASREMSLIGRCPGQRIRRASSTRPTATSDDQSLDRATATEFATWFKALADPTPGQPKRPPT